MITILRQKEKAKKRKYMSACLEQRKHFTPLAFSADGLYGREADAFMKRMASLLAKKWARPYSQVCGWLKGRIAITIARATHLCLRGSRVPISQTPRRHALFEDGAGITMCRW